MKLLVLSESANHVSCRYRVQAFEPALRRAGWDMTVRPLSGERVHFFTILREAARSDVVLIQRRLLAPARLRLLRHFARRLIYDVDDALFLRDSNSPRPAESWQRRNRFRLVVSLCDAVIAGNDYLENCARRWSRHGCVVRIPTCIDPDATAPAADQGRTSGLRLAWIGSASTLPSLNEIAPALSRASDEIPGLELHVICDQAAELPGVNIVFRHWSPETEASDLADCDVGISWLPDHPWSRGKCGLKVLQYMAAGLPVIVNAFGIHRQIVGDGVHGLVVNHPGDVSAALLRLAAAPDLRRQMGMAGRARVAGEFSVQQWSGVFVDVLGSAAGRAVSRQAS